MNWEETILYARSRPEYADLIKYAYYGESLRDNAERYHASPEFHETLAIFRKYSPSGTTVLDIGAGNGISSIALALEGYRVTAVEPDPSNVVGAGAIRSLISEFKLTSVQVIQSPAEDLVLQQSTYDIVFARQSMHHARNLDKFLENAAHLLKAGGLLITVRDHVIFSEGDKQWFLRTHPLHHLYGGENAYTPEEYERTFQKAGLSLVKRLRHFESVINYWPATQDEIDNYVHYVRKARKAHLIRKLGPLANFPGVSILYNLYLFLRGQRIERPSEINTPGRMYTYVLKKP